eukprot:Tamp_24517.p2 GENE.Tamp_24517~~Tamp_24517.p2  ORF type:complete len:121 (-),score=19.72 Tamp_24517:136-498(-)
MAAAGDYDYEVAVRRSLFNIQRHHALLASQGVASLPAAGTKGRAKGHGGKFTGGRGEGKSQKKRKPDALIGAESPAKKSCRLLGKERVLYDESYVDKEGNLVGPAREDQASSSSSDEASD